MVHNFLINSPSLIGAANFVKFLTKNRSTPSANEIAINKGFKYVEPWAQGLCQTEIYSSASALRHANKRRLACSYHTCRSDLRRM